MTSEFLQNGEVKDYNAGRSFDDMKKFVEENLEAKCVVEDPKDCTEKETKYIEKRKGMDKAANDKELTRLGGMASKGTMKAELKQWLHQRINILKQM